MPEAAHPLAETALDRLLGARDVLDGAILSNGGELLAGDATLAEPAARLLAAAPDADQIEVELPAGAVIAARSRGHAVVVVCRRAALPSLVAYDLRLALATLGEDLPAAA